jgi:hypothetical protein
MGDRTHANALFEHLARDFVEPPEDMLLPEHERAPLGVPCTAIYSRTDGVARWHGCIEAERDSCENIEVLGSHSGLGFNPAAIYAIADRLNQPEGHWKPFKAPGYLRGLFPKPVWWEDRSRRAAAAA